jgi:hypothetical protein
MAAQLGCWEAVDGSGGCQRAAQSAHPFTSQAPASHLASPASSIASSASTSSPCVSVGTPTVFRWFCGAARDAADRGAACGLSGLQGSTGPRVQRSGTRSAFPKSAHPHNPLPPTPHPLNPPPHLVHNRLQQEVGGPLYDNCVARRRQLAAHKVHAVGDAWAMGAGAGAVGGALWQLSLFSTTQPPHHHAAPSSQERAVSPAVTISSSTATGWP